MHRLAHASLVFAVLCSSACATVEPTQSAAPVRVQISVGEGALALLDVRGAGVPDLGSEDAEHRLRLTFRSTRVAETVWTVADPRWVHSEYAAPANTEPTPYLNAQGVLTVELPDEGTLRIEAEPEDENAAWHWVGELQVARTQAGDDDALVDVNKDILGAPVKVRASSAQSPVRVLFLPEGFTEAELPAFRERVDLMISTLERTPGYGEHAGMFEAYRLDVKSNQSGIDDPANNVARDTAFDVSFGDGKKESRRALSVGSKANRAIQRYIAKTAGDLQPEATIYVANTSEWAGASLDTVFGKFASVKRPKCLLVSMAEGTELMLGHELGHALMGLADEYDAAGVSASTACARTRGGALLHVFDRTRPNTATNLNKLPWADMLNTSTLPTPVTSSESEDPKVVGAFEGAEYCSKGVYRPQASCLMQNSRVRMCAVCKRQLSRFLDDRGFVPAPTLTPGDKL